MRVGDKVVIVGTPYNGKVGIVDEVIKLEIFEDVFMVNFGEISTSFKEKSLKLIK